MQLSLNTAAKNNWLRVKIDGIKNLKIPSEAEIEVKAGAGSQKKSL